jgi:hypothetical protein
MQESGGSRKGLRPTRFPRKGLRPTRFPRKGLRPTRFPRKGLRPMRFGGYMHRSPGSGDGGEFAAQGAGDGSAVALWPAEKPGGFPAEREWEEVGGGIGACGKNFHWRGAVVMVEYRSGLLVPSGIRSIPRWWS